MDKKSGEMDCMASKVSFVAGVVLIVTILKDWFELWTTIPAWAVVGYCIFCLGLLLFVTKSNRFDAKFGSRKVENFSNLLTLGSVLIFVLENTIIRYEQFATKIEVIVIFGLLGVALIVGALYLLLAKD